MSVVRFGESKTVAILATDTSFSIASQDRPLVIRLISNVPFHIAWNSPATTEDARLTADCAEYVSLGVYDTLHFMRATGAVDGTAWATVLT